MRDGGPLLIASEVRERLRAACAPIVEQVLQRLDAPAQALAEGRLVVEANRQEYRCRVGLLCQAHPLMLRVVLHGLPHPVELERLPGDCAPGLAEAVDDVVGGVLAGMPEGDAIAALAAAAAVRPGGLLVSMDLLSGDIRVLVARAGEDLSRAVELGGLGDAAATLH